MSICNDIIDEIRNNKEKIREYLKITDDKLEGKDDSMIDNIEQKPDTELHRLEEDYLTFILACAYATDGNRGCHSLEKLLCGGNQHDFSEKQNYHIWFHAQPFKGRSSPKLDLAFGNINRPSGNLDDRTISKIVYDPPLIGGSRICFVEMKTIKDIDASSTGNPIYNQLARYIRASLIFQKTGRFPDAVHVTLVTPRIFIKNLKSRFYGYKYIEYACPEINPENIKADIKFPIKNEELYDDWIKPGEDGLNERLPILNLHWIPYEDILDNVPNVSGSSLKKNLTKIRSVNPLFEKPSEPI